MEEHAFHSWMRKSVNNIHANNGSKLAPVAGLAPARRFKSTKTTKRKQAEAICEKWEKAAREAKHGRLTPERARQIIEEGVAQIAEASGVPLPRHTIRQYFESWMKKGASEGALTRYQGIVDAFLKHPGNNAKRPLAGLTEDDILSVTN
jgi:hypothetical protein